MTPRYYICEDNLTCYPSTIYRVCDSRRSDPVTGEDATADWYSDDPRFNGRAACRKARERCAELNDEN